MVSCNTASRDLMRTSYTRPRASLLVLVTLRRLSHRWHRWHDYIDLVDGVNFKMLVTLLVINFHHFFTLALGTKIQQMSPTFNICHQHPQIVFIFSRQYQDITMTLNSEERYENHLKNQKTSLISAFINKQRTESQFNQQKSTIKSIRKFRKKMQQILTRRERDTNACSQSSVESIIEQ